MTRIFCVKHKSKKCFLELLNVDLDMENRYQIATDSDERVALSKQYCAYLEKELEKNPRNLQALTHLGVLSWEPFHNYEKSIEHLKKVIDYDPRNVEARFWLATCYYHDRCEYEKSEQMALEALAIDPRRADCLARLAVIYWQYYDNLEKAIHCLQKSVEYTPDWPMLYHLLITLFLEVKNIKSAEFYLEKALELCSVPPSNPRNGVEKYYENNITGRGWTNKKKEFQSLIEQIQLWV